jgi:hypothetical protein
MAGEVDGRRGEPAVSRLSASRCAEYQQTRYRVSYVQLRISRLFERPDLGLIMARWNGRPFSDQRRPRRIADAQIAAIAASRGFTVATRDEVPFKAAGISSNIRPKLGLPPGDSLEARIEGEHIVLTPRSARRRNAGSFGIESLVCRC